MNHNQKKDGWKCPYCGEVFRTRQEKQEHVRQTHPEMIGVAWNKGLTKETNSILAQRAETWKKNLADGKFKHAWVGRRHSAKTKAKISQSRKKYLEEHPDMVPYKLNHKSKGESYAERYFREWLDKEGISYQQEYQFHLFAFDFLVNDKIDLEIDGDQHFLDSRIVEHDKQRNQAVEDAGYIVKRISWSYFKSLNDDKRTTFLSELKNFLENN